MAKWIFDSSNETQVIGSFDLQRFIAWHDDRVRGVGAFDTIVHEDTHARAIAGSFLHLSLIADRFNVLAGNPSLEDSQYWDFVAFHEAQPKAYDIVSGRTTSHYTEPAIIARAEALAALAHDIERQAAVIGLRRDGLAVMILRAIALAVSDHFIGETPTSAAELVSNLSTVVATSRAEDLFPNGFESRLPITDQLRKALAAILSDQLDRNIVICSDSYRTINMFAILTRLLALEESATFSGFRDLFVPAMNLLFLGALVPHAAVRPDRRLVMIATSDYILRRMVANDPGTLETIDSKLQGMDELHKRKRYSNPGTYVYDGFLSKYVHEFDQIEDNLVLLYLNSVFGAFPTTLISLFDQVIDPRRYIISREERDSLFRIMQQQDESWDSIVENYDSIRRLIWRELSYAAIDMPHWLVRGICASLEGHQKTGSIDFDLQAGPVDFLFGTEHAFRVTFQSQEG